jgi:hypothetical protein
MTKTIQQIGIAALLAAMATLAQAQSQSTGTGESRGTGQGSSYGTECPPDASGSRQPGAAQKSRKQKGDKGAAAGAGTSPVECPPAMGRDNRGTGTRGGTSGGSGGSDTNR